MTAWVALLRGINVGGRNSVPMAGLRDAVASLGYSDVATYIQSGNVVFKADRPDPGSIATVVEERFGLAVDVALRSAGDMEAVVSANPFDDTAKVHVGFLIGGPGEAVDPGVAEAPEAFAVTASEVYLYLPAGIGRSKLPAAVGRRVGTPMTVRNWRTVTAMAALAGEL